MKNNLLKNDFLKFPKQMTLNFIKKYFYKSGILITVDSYTMQGQHILEYFYKKFNKKMADTIALDSSYKIHMYLEYFATGMYKNVDSACNGDYRGFLFKKTMAVNKLFRLSKGTYAYLSNQRFVNSKANPINDFLAHNGDNHWRVHNCYDDVEIFIFGKNANYELKKIYEFINKSYKGYGTKNKIQKIIVSRGNKDKASFSNSFIIINQLPKTIYPDYILSKISNYINGIFKLKNSHKNISESITGGILLYGKPGTGKSSLINLITAKLEAAQIIIDITNMPKPNDIAELSDRLIQIFDEPAHMGIYKKVNIVVVYEDIDILCNDRNAKDTNMKKNLHILLQLIDGSLSSILNSFNMGYVNIINIATTNNIDALDPALIRAGRFDLKIEMPEFDKDQAKSLCELYNVDESILKSITFPTTPADIKNEIIRNINGISE